MIVKGTFFPAASSRAIPAQASVEERRLRIADEKSALLAECPLRKARVSARLGHLMRRIELPDGSRFETEDNDGVDALLRSGGRLLPSSLLHGVESSLKWVALAVVIAAVSVAAFVRYGLPAGALWLAQKTPRAVAVEVSNQTLATLDRFALAPSTLSAADKRHAAQLFARVTAAGRQDRSQYRLLLRNGRRGIGPNAFALPDGTIVLTDQLYALVKRDDELEGVFGHEMAHVDHRHGLQMVYEASLLPAAIAFMTGDASQFGQVATVLPMMLIESSYSRDFEQQADDDSAATMKRIGADPAALGELLVRLDKQLCGKAGCQAGWLGSHPDTAARATRLRDEARTK